MLETDELGDSDHSDGGGAGGDAPGDAPGHPAQPGVRQMSGES